MSDLSVVRWQRYGKDRLYANAEDGARVGWLDVLSGRSTIEDRTREPAPPSPAQLNGAMGYATIDWRDVAANRPGEAAREQAVAPHHPDASVWVGGNTVMINGHRHPYVHNARFEAERAAKMLTGAVGFPVQEIGLVAIVGAHKGFTVNAQPEGAVKVVARKKLTSWLLDQPCTVAAAQLTAI